MTRIPTYYLVFNVTAFLKLNKTTLSPCFIVYFSNLFTIMPGVTVRRSHSVPFNHSWMVCLTLVVTNKACFFNYYSKLDSNVQTLFMCLVVSVPMWVVIMGFVCLAFAYKGFLICTCYSTEWGTLTVKYLIKRLNLFELSVKSEVLLLSVLLCNRKWQ